MYNSFFKLKRNRTLLLIGIIIMLITVNLIVVQVLLHKKNDNSITINLIGKQLLYSYNISNYFFSLENKDGSFKTDITNDFKVWKKIHIAFLNGDADLGIHSLINLNLKSEIEKLTINVTNIEQIIHSNKPIDHNTIKSVIQNQYSYAEKMNYILSEMYLDSESRYKTINYIDIFFAISSIIGIILIFFLIYLPVEKKIDESYKIYIKKLQEIAWDQSHLIRAPVSNLLGLTRFLKKKSTTINDPELLKLILIIEQEAQHIDKEVHAVVSKTIVSNNDEDIHYFF